MTLKVAAAMNKVFLLLLVAVVSLSATQQTAWAADIALVGAKVYPAPGTAPIEDAVILITGERITAVGTRDDIHLLPDATVLDLTGKTITAGLWNAHVHFSLPPLETIPDDVVATYVRDMLLQYGFVHVLDAGSLPGVTLEIRRRIDAGDMPGPSIIMAGGSLVPRGASPFYLRPNVLPDAPVAAEAQNMVDFVLEAGADGIKIYSGSIVSASGHVIDVVPMDVDVVRAVTDAARARGAFVMAHPSNYEGAWAAINGGVDYFSHTFPQEDWDRTIPAAMVEKGIGMTPTLKLYSFEGPRFGQTTEQVRQSIGLAQAQLKLFSDLGGDVLFGTDVGYVTDFDPTDEYTYMTGAGLTFDEILASLTTTPARRFGMDDRAGQVTTGLDADVVVLSGDPAQDITAFARSELVIRRGQVVFARPGAE